MPTHQGKTHTDILIGDGGENVQESSEFEFSATYATTATLEYADLAPGTDRCYSGYELLVRDSAGLVIATFAARYKAWIDRGSATGPKTIDIVNNFTPAPSGSQPGWPLSPVTTTEREWRVDAFDATGNLYAQAYATWQLRSTVATGATVIQTVTDQTDTLLRVNLVYMTGRTVHLTVVASMFASAKVVGRVTADPPDVTDRFTP
ncbi:MAG TPA: hypothetical protein VM869_31175 [Enhygromyxa sp.]|nr:hypothetical protein [Enhygromyxa sp.]